MTTFTFRSNDGTVVTVDATNEEQARRAAMVKRWGEHADGIVPHAPDYKGRGLSLVDHRN